MALLFIWFATGAAILSFGIGKWIPTIGAISRLVLMPFFALTVIKYGIDTGFNTPKIGDFVPDGGNPWWLLAYAAAPLLFFNLVGFELPNAAGDEMKDAQRDVPFAVLRSAGVRSPCTASRRSASCWCCRRRRCPARPASSTRSGPRLTAWGGTVDYQTAADGTTNIVISYTTFSQFLAYAMGAMFVWTIVSSGTTWIMGADRAIAIGCIDGCGPACSGRFSSRFGTPINVNLLSGVISTVFFVLATKLAGSSAFAVVLSMATLTTVISYALIFPALIKLRVRRMATCTGPTGAGRYQGRVDHRRHHDRLVGVLLDREHVAVRPAVPTTASRRPEFELWVVGVLGRSSSSAASPTTSGARPDATMVQVPLEGHESGGRGDGVRQRRLITEWSTDGAATGGPVRKPWYVPPRSETTRRGRGL